MKYIKKTIQDQMKIETISKTSQTCLPYISWQLHYTYRVPKETQIYGKRVLDVSDRGRELEKLQKELGPHIPWSLDLDEIYLACIQWLKHYEKVYFPEHWEVGYEVRRYYWNPFIMFWEHHLGDLEQLHHLPWLIDHMHYSSRYKYRYIYCKEDSCYPGTILKDWRGY